jgi:magnesium chelatase subunit D
MMLEAARAMLPPDLLARMEAGRAARNAAAASGTGAAKKGNRRGRPLPSRAGRLGSDTRVDLVATLRAAAPWQPLRRQTTGQDDRLHVRMSDVRVRQFEERSDRAIIFVVDASGSAALARLAEAKGAIELLLGEAYARRDHVALVAFGATGPMSSCRRRDPWCRPSDVSGSFRAGAAHRCLRAQGRAGACRACQGKGMTPSIALLTDGRANVDLSGIANRAQAAEDAR